MHLALALRKAPAEQKVVLGALLDKGKMPLTGLKEITHPRMSQSAFSRLMRDMAELGFVRKENSNRQSPWMLTDEAKMFALPPQLRDKTPFNDARVLGHGRPFLSPEQLATLKAAVNPVAMDAATLIRGLSERFLIDLTWASSRLEGSTYDYLDTEKLVKFNEASTDHERMETMLILNHKNAIKWLLEKAEDETVLTVDDVCVMHAHLMRGLMDYSELGKIRNNPVKIGGSTYVPSSDPLMLRAGLVNLINRAAQTDEPHEASLGLMAGASYLQAFGDGNKRVGRLLASLPLLRAGLPPLSFVGWEKSEYITGLVVFYETGNPEILAEGFVQNQLANSPVYAEMVKAHRIPSRLEIVRQDQIRQALIEVLEGDSPENAVRRGFSPDEQDEALDIVVKMRESLTPHNAPALGIPASLVPQDDADEIPRP